MPTNGTLKYKQDNGSIVELHPVGVDAEARALANAETERAKAAEQKLENDKANKSAIPDVSVLVTKNTYDAGQAEQDAKIAALKAVAPDILPYQFDRISISSVLYPSFNTSYAAVYIDLPWIHSQNHKLSARMSGGSGFLIVNLSNGSVQSVDDGITVSASCNSSKPYHVNVTFQIPATFFANTAYLVVSSSTLITIE